MSLRNEGESMPRLRINQVYQPVEPKSERERLRGALETIAVMLGELPAEPPYTAQCTHTIKQAYGVATEALS